LDLHAPGRPPPSTFLAQAGECGGDGYPCFVEREFRRYLAGGLLCNGFARLRCAWCGYERLVGFSCKGKLCPSCLARRSADTVAWLVDRVLPEAGYRQWVLTFPWTLRFRLAADRALLSTLLRAFLEILFAWQRRRGRALGIAGGHTGAVTFVQRFAGALNLNPHLHSILPDGLWFADSSAGAASGRRLRFEPLPPPTTAEVEELTATIADRLRDRVAAAWEAEGSDYLDPDLAALCEAFFFSRTPPLGMRESPWLPGVEEDAAGGRPGKPLCASLDGFSLHAAQSVGPQDREALERLLRYGLRPPFAHERLSRRADGKVVYRLRRPWPKEQGATHLVLEPLDFLRRLAALVSFPYSHQVRYHGVFANRSRMRPLLPPPPPRPEGPEGPGPVTATTAELGFDGAQGVDAKPLVQVPVPAPPAPPKPPPPAPRHPLPWAQLLRRLLHVDALACPRCSTPARSLPMVVLAFLTDPDVLGRILQHLGLPSVAPALAPARSSAAPLGLAMSMPMPDGGPGREGAESREPGHLPLRQRTTRPPP
jgi:hypothetical protein